MSSLLAIVNFIAQNYQQIISAIVALLSGVIAVALLIPGAQPEKALQSIVDFLAKISVKKSE
jgi:hypothetical protein